MTCKKCEKSGLSILLVRPTAMAIEPEIAPAGAALLKPHEGTVAALGLPSLKKSNHALRLLRREGYVYVYFPDEKPVGQIKRWQAWRVHDKGALIQQGDFVFETSEFACDKKITHPHDVRTLCFAEPERIAKVWVGFSMNWWSDGLKAKVASDLKAAGMVEIDLVGGPPKHGFAAQAALLNRHVADYALQSLKHGGLAEEATPFYAPGQVSPMQAARAMATVMQKQSEGSKGQPMVVAIPDPIGLAADLNGIRMARDKRDKDRLLAPDTAWPLMSNQLLGSLKGAIEASAMASAKAVADGHTSQKTWNEVKDKAYFREGGYTWQPTSGVAADGSPNGQVVAPMNRLREQRIAIQGKSAAAAQWRAIASQIDEDKRKKWRLQFDAQRCAEADRLALYEDDWLDAAQAPASLAYFARHFDENDLNRFTAPTSPGATYAGESYLIHYPQPLSKALCYARYLDHLFAKPIVHPDAVALRAMFGNQKSVIAQVHALLMGSADRSGDNNMRDKTLDVFKGLVTSSWGPQYSWIKAAVIGMSTGQFSAIAAGALQFGISLRWPDGLTIPHRAQTYLKLLPALSVAEQTLLGAMRTALEKGKPSIPVVIRFNWLMEEALEHMERNPFDYSAADRNAIRNRRVGSRITVQQMAMLEAQTGNIQLIPSEAPHLPGASPRSLGGVTMAQFEQQVKATDLSTYDRATTRNIKAYVAASHEVALGWKDFRTDAGFGVAVMVVQGLGLVWAMRDLLHELGKGENANLLDKYLSVGDGVAGFTGGLLETWAAAHRLQMVAVAEGAAMSRASGLLSNLGAGAALAGLAGGVLNMVMSFRKAANAKPQGDQGAYNAHSAAAAAFGLNGAVMTSVALNALTHGAVNRALGEGAQKVATTLLRKGVQRAVLIAIVEMSAEGLVLAVTGVVTGLGWVLLVGGVVATVYAAISERSELQRWVARGYFGSDAENRYNDMTREVMEFDLVIGQTYKPMTEQENARLLERHPAPPIAPPSPPEPLGNPMGDGWGTS